MLNRAYTRLRTPLNSAKTFSSVRTISWSRQCSSDIHSQILNILREQPPVQSGTEQVQKKKNILILSPDETQNKDYVKYVDTLSRKKRVGKSATSGCEIRDMDLYSESLLKSNFKVDIISSMEELRPAESNNVFSVKSAAQSLTQSFTRAQLAYYVQAKESSLYRVSHTKAQLANTIVTKIWGEAGSDLTNVIQKEKIPLTHQEMFLLLSHRGAILKLIKSAVSSVDFDPCKKELILAGTEFQIRNAKINLAHRFENAVREEIDLTTIQALYEEKFGSFTFKEFGKSIEIYFQHLDGHKYELCALGRAHVRRIQRLLVWVLDYNLHAQSKLHLPQKEELVKAALIPFTDDYAMTWKQRSKAHFELIDETEPRDIPASVEREIINFSDSNLDQLEETMDYNISYDTFTPVVEDETFDSLQLLNDNSLEHVIEDLVAGPKEGSKLVENSVLSKDAASKIYNELVDFAYTQNLRGLKFPQLDEPMFTITLGRVLFESEKTDSVLSSPPAKPNSASPFTFNTNIPQVYDKVLREGMVENFGNESVSNDPHTYSLQFKFLPSPYAETSEAFELHDNMKYPPIEMWMQLNDNKVVDIESLQVVTVEGENNSYVCLPKYKSDLKVSCQLTGQVIDEGDVEELKIPKEQSQDQHSNSNLKPERSYLETVLDAPSSKYPRLAKQEGIQKFLESSKLNFSGKAPTSIAPFVDVLINGKIVPYAFVCANYRRELEVDLENNQTAQISIVDGGSLGGRRCEIRFLGDFSKGVDRPAFDHLLNSTCEFIKDL